MIEIKDQQLSTNKNTMHLDYLEECPADLELAILLVEVICLDWRVAF